MRLYSFLCRNPRKYLDDIKDLTIRYSGLPESYIRKKMEENFVYYRTPKMISYQDKKVERTRFRFNEHRPWTNEFAMENSPNSHYADILIEPIKDWPIFLGDRVEVLDGKDKGKQGVISIVVQERNWVFVQGLNTRLKSFRIAPNMPSVVMRVEMPLNVLHQVALVDPSDLKSTEIEWRYDEEGEKVRVSKRTGRIIPYPHSHFGTYNMQSPSAYKESDKDTPQKVVEKITFKPMLKTFEMDIMDSMDIKEDRIPKPTYWY